jgi:glucokinase-like ROK family protein
MKADASRRISDHASMKLNNQLVILRRIRDEGPISRVDLKEKTRLSWGTITTSTKELLGLGIITETGSVTTGVGRRPVELDMNRENNFVLGLQLGTLLVRSVLVDVKGTVVDELDAPVDARGTSEEILSCLVKSARQMLRRHSVSRGSLAGIGIAAPGAVDFSSGVCLYAPHHPQWKNVPLRRRFEQAFGVPCFVDHTFNCFVVSEKLFGFGRGLDNFICVLLGTGMSAGIVLNGEVYRGADSFAGEFGHTCIDADGPLCACGNNGCIEAYVSGPAIAALAVDALKARPGGAVVALTGGDTGKVTAEVLGRAAGLGDRLALEIFSRMGKILGVGISNLINIFNPQAIILGGGVSKAAEFFLPSCLETIRKRAWHASTKDVKVSSLERGEVLGAAAIVLQQLFSTGQIVQRAEGQAAGRSQGPAGGKPAAARPRRAAAGSRAAGAPRAPVRIRP